jgi:uncharacterized protein YbgA (DUF1722 family)/uncharacterized protein YbbK (DUF523 family)
MGDRSAQTRPIRIGISACLLGEEVRFDGGHKRDSFLTDTFGKFVEWVPVCPEVEAGFGTPREAMRLVRNGRQVRLLTIKTARDLTATLDSFSERRVAELNAEDLSGYVLKKDSPSCGLERVKVYDTRGGPARTGRGRFAVKLLERFPELPIEEEGRLSDPRLRENFVDRVFGYWRLRGLFGGRWTVGALVRFHTAHKLILMSHAPKAYEHLGRLVSRAKATARDELERRYTRAFMAALSTPVTRGRHANVLQHMAGYFKRDLDPAAKTELAEAIEEYRAGIVPLIVPITLVRHHVRSRGVSYLADQLYLDPHRRELMLRNHV